MFEKACSSNVITIKRNFFAFFKHSRQLRKDFRQIYSSNRATFDDRWNLKNLASRHKPRHRLFFNLALASNQYLRKLIFSFLKAALVKLSEYENFDPTSRTQKKSYRLSRVNSGIGDKTDRPPLKIKHPKMISLFLGLQTSVQDPWSSFALYIPQKLPSDSQGSTFGNGRERKKILFVVPPSVVLRREGIRNRGHLGRAEASPVASKTFLVSINSRKSLKAPNT